MQENRKFTFTALSLGGNQGDVPLTFRRAVKSLADAGLRNVDVSSLYRTAPVGCVPGTPDFVNAALAGQWPGRLEQLLCLCKELEVAAGRPADHAPCGNRTLDLDIVFFGDLIQRDRRLAIPHPEAARRLFVLVPLAEIIPEYQFPDLGRTVLAQCLAHPDSETRRRLESAAIPFDIDL